KVDRRLDQRQRLNQPLAPGLGRHAKGALHLPERLPPLALRFRCHQVGEAFHRGQIELAVLESSPGELAGLGRAQALDVAEHVEHRGDHGEAAVQLQLGDVLAGLALRRGKPQRQRLIDKVARCGIADAAERGHARGGDLTGQRAQRRASARPGNADDSDGRGRAAGGESEDGGALGHRGAGERRRGGWVKGQVSRKSEAKSTAASTHRTGPGFRALRARSSGLRNYETEHRRTQPRYLSLWEEGWGEGLQDYRETITPHPPAFAFASAGDLSLWEKSVNEHAAPFAQISPLSLPQRRH